MKSNESTASKMNILTILEVTSFVFGKFTHFFRVEKENLPPRRFYVKSLVSRPVWSGYLAQGRRSREWGAGAQECGNLRLFLLPRFYVLKTKRLILADTSDFEVSRCDVYTMWKFSQKLREIKFTVHSVEICKFFPHDFFVKISSN